ncbi:MAG: hypothetical protein MJY96_03490 [Bacteroidaceae bacterium]|nr:hypothetical protein [Candidatus Colenecus caballi]MCQ2072170.1 hypothetical protein [Bacteroidaceae bacterium]
MWKTLIIVILMLLAAVALLSVSIWAKKGGKFPNIHVGHNPAMRKRGIGCVETQHAQAQKKNPLAVNERSNNK